ncbi:MULTISPECIES: trimeric intracellular cation channel family protein [unclassified Paracoccus (in: a-proteobacteria)]|uniref:trimeric intracellular cation channel family protein n=1 Tax=unclassified Paracoccus (in: a-proteobacteria) TaxID=2688777 RepID=UPI0012B29FB4|nr:MULTISPECIES: trimeric intracellular cation channel family protein [unclassified Paracoccus (in: a-proteobacteria)]UXU74752.1 trimeric intracellular cation channel family protein [Paracoccus sp. SMMA_5]UXU80649.1 trimeric intracellular cation channel family protein [Paracoccus sp. SMMA_5_TC]
MSLEVLIAVLDHASVLVFALTGALVASRGQLDVVGFIFFATLTGVGGGTLRDLVLGRTPVFWVDRPELILLTSGAAIVVFFSAHLLESRYRAIVWLDAFALAVAVPAGVGVALEAGASPVVTVMMGVMTGTFGGLMRDVVGNEVPMVLRQGELYITATFGGAVAALTLLWLGTGRGWSLIGCALVVLALRAGSMWLGWRLPVYKARPPRN